MYDKLNERFLHRSSERCLRGQKEGHAVSREHDADLQHFQQLIKEAAALEARHAVIPHGAQELLHAGVSNELQSYTYGLV